MIRNRRIAAVSTVAVPVLLPILMPVLTRSKQRSAGAAHIVQVLIPVLAALATERYQRTVTTMLVAQLERHAIPKAWRWVSRSPTVEVHAAQTTQWKLLARVTRRSSILNVVIHAILLVGNGRRPGFSHRHARTIRHPWQQGY